MTDIGETERTVTALAERTAMEDAAAAAVATLAATQAAVAGTVSAPLPLLTPVSSLPLSLSLIRGEVAAYLSAHLLGGDALAAEWLLLHLIARVVGRRGGLVIGGEMCALGIRGLPDHDSDVNGKGKGNGGATAAAPTAATRGGGATPSTASDGNGDQPPPSRPSLPLRSALSPCAQAIYTGLANLLPRVAPLPLTVDNLNSLSIAPSMAGDSESLAAGVLQLPVGTQVVVDASVLSTGKLGAGGVIGLRDLQGVINDQCLPYRYPYYELNNETDVRLLVLSHGKTLLHTPTSIALSPAAQGNLHAAATAAMATAATATTRGAPVYPTAAAPAPLHVSEGFFPRARLYLSSVAHLPYTIPDHNGMTDVCNADMAAEQRVLRAQGRSAVDTRDLHRLMTIARLVSLSHGSSELTREHWSAARSLDRARMATLPVEGRAAAAGGAGRPSTPAHGAATGSAAAADGATVARPAGSRRMED